MTVSSERRAVSSQKREQNAQCGTRYERKTREKEKGPRRERPGELNDRNVWKRLKRLELESE